MMYIFILASFGKIMTRTTFMKLVSEFVMLRSSVLRLEDSINVYLLNDICFVDSTHQYLKGDS